MPAPARERCAGAWAGSDSSHERLVLFFCPPSPLSSASLSRADQQQLQVEQARRMTTQLRRRVDSQLRHAFATNQSWSVYVALSRTRTARALSRPGMRWPCWCVVLTHFSLSSSPFLTPVPIVAGRWRRSSTRRGIAPSARSARLSTTVPMLRATRDDSRHSHSASTASHTARPSPPSWVSSGGGRQHQDGGKFDATKAP